MGPRVPPYSLPELSDYIPERWRRPAVYEGAVGRNCDLFAAGLKWAGREINLPYPVVEVLRQMNGATERPLPENEVSWIASSIERYRARWVDKGRFFTPAERTAWHSQGGFAWGRKRRERTKGRDKAILAAYLEGMKQCAKIADKYGLIFARAQSRHIVQKVMVNFLSFRAEVNQENTSVHTQDDMSGTWFVFRPIF